MISNSRRAGLLSAATLMLAALTGCSLDPSRYVRSGNKYFERGRYEEAELLYQHALDSNKRYGEAWYRLGLLHLRTGRPDDARGDFFRAVDLEPNRIEVIVALADLDLGIYHTDPSRFKLLRSEVQELIGKIAAQDPNNFDGLRLAGFLAAIDQNLPLAVLKLEAASAIHPWHAEATRVLVQVLFASQQGAAAVNRAERLIAHDKTYGPIYDVLYRVYMDTRQFPRAEEILKRKVRNNPTEGSYCVQLAEFYRVTERRPEMLATLSQITSDRKSFPNGHLLAGDYWVSIHNLDEAAKQFSEGLNQDPAQKLAYLRRLAFVYMLQGKSADANRVVESLLKIDPNDVDSVGLHAALQLQNPDKQAAERVVEELRPMLEEHPENAAIHYHLGHAYQIVGDSASLELARVQFEEALRWKSDYGLAAVGQAAVQFALGEDTKAVVSAQQALATDPGNLEARLVCARALSRMGETEKAREQLQAALQGHPDSREAHYQTAALDLQDRNLADASQHFSALQAMGDPRGSVGLAECRARTGDYAGAIQFLAAELKKWPDQYDYRFAIARYRFQTGQYAEAISDFQWLIGRNPNSSDLYTRLGKAQWMDGDHQGATETFQRAHKASPGDPTPYIELASLENGAGETAQARRWYTEALRLQPDNPAALSHLAYLDAETGMDLDQALAFAQDARVKKPNDPDILDTLGLIYLKQNRTDDGMRTLSDLVERSPERAVYRLHWAMALYQNGNTEEAKKQLGQALRSNPTDKERTEIQKLMARIG